MKKKLLIEGMSCQNCVNHVTEALTILDGVSNVSVDLTNKSATLTVNPQVTDSVIKQSVTGAGYEVTLITEEP